MKIDPPTERKFRAGDMVRFVIFYSGKERTLEGRVFGWEDGRIHWRSNWVYTLDVAGEVYRREESKLTLITRGAVPCERS
jgi:hypothetical protein